MCYNAIDLLATVYRGRIKRMVKKTIKQIPAPAQDILTILDVILQLVNVIEAVYRLLTNILGQ